MQSSKEARKEAKENQNLQRISYISLAALSKHKGVSVLADLTSKLDAQSSFIALNTGQFQRGDERRQSASAFAAADELCTGGRELYAPTKSVLRVNQSSSFQHSHSSFVSPSVFHLIPELQRGQSSYNIDQSESSSFSATSEWYTNFDDIDYLWAVVPTAQSFTESVKAAVLDSYTDSSLPTILQPRFKPKTPGTALALWLPNIMASLAKRLTEENPSDIKPALPAGGDKDILKQNISLLLKKDFITTNWPFKGNKQSDDLSDQSHVSQQLQKNRRKNGGITIHRTKFKHLRGGDSSDHKLDSENSPRSQGSATMDKKLSWRRAPWNKSTRIKYVEANQKDEKSQDDINHDEVENHEDVKLENYDSTPVKSRRRARSQGSQDIDSERSSSAELPMSPDSPDFLDADDSMVFFNYNDDGTSYTCTLSPIQSLSNPMQLDNTSERTYSTYSSCSGETSSMLTPVIPASSIGSITSIDSEDEVELYEESFRLETEHINCECIKYSRDDHDDFPYMKTLEDDSIDTENKGSQNIDIDSERSSSADHYANHAHDESLNENCTLKRGGSKGKSKFKLKRVPSTHSSRQRRITDTGRLPPNSHKEDDAVDPQQVKSEKDMRDKIEYIRVASLEDAKISAKLYIRIPEKVNLCKIQTHLLLCAMRAFFTCTEGIEVRWVKSFHDKIYQLLQRKDTKIKFSCPNVMESDNTVCLLLSHDASILLRDRQSKLLVTIADILQIMTDNLMVLELNKKTNKSPPKKSKSKTMKLLDSESMICYDTQTEWFLPVFL